MSYAPRLLAFRVRDGSADRLLAWHTLSSQTKDKVLPDLTLEGTTSPGSATVRSPTTLELPQVGFWSGLLHCEPGREQEPQGADGRMGVTEGGGDRDRVQARHSADRSVRGQRGRRRWARPACFSSCSPHHGDSFPFSEEETLEIGQNREPSFRTEAV